MLVTTYQPTTRIRRRFHPVHLIIYCLPSGTGLKPVALGLMNASHKIARLKNTTLSNASSAAGHPVLPNCLSATLSFLVGMVRPIFCWIPVALTQVITKSTPRRCDNVVRIRTITEHVFLSRVYVWSEWNRRSAMATLRL
jgi:hypothetical protein